MKSQIRVLGIDDSPFSFKDKRTSVVGVVMRIPSYIEAVLRTYVDVDGCDSCNMVSEMINSSRYKEQVKLVMMDGVALGGFNVIDIEELYEKIGLPVVTITRAKPDFSGMTLALKEHFDDWSERLNVINKGELHEVETSHKPIYVKIAGVELAEVKELIKLSTIQGVIPEPIRAAHLIASGMALGESSGRA